MKNIFILFAIAGSLMAQTTGQNVVNQTIQASTTFTTDTTFPTPTLQNIGQTNHLGIVNVTNFGVVVGDTADLFCQVLGSVNGSLWKSIGNLFTIHLTGGLGSAGLYQCTGYGTYPYVKVQTSMINMLGGTVTATVSVNYRGASIAYNPIVDMLGSNVNMSSFQSSALTGGNVLTTAFSATLSGQVLNVYGLALYADAVATTLTVYCDGLAAIPIYTMANLGTTRTVIIPVGLRPLFTCPNTGSGFFYKLAGASTTAMDVTYRFE